jgi:hypothetical protein
MTSAISKPPVRIVEDNVTALAMYAMTLVMAWMPSAGGHKHSSELKQCGFESWFAQPSNLVPDPVNPWQSRDSDNNLTCLH